MEEKVKEAILEVYKYSSVGSGLHIVLDDESVEDEHIKWCLKEAIPEIENIDERIACERCAELLLQVPVKERERIVYGYGSKESKMF